MAPYLDRLTPTACATRLRDPVTVGASMKYSSRSMDASITSGAQWIRMAMLWKSWSKVTEIRNLPGSFFAVVEGTAKCPGVIITKVAEQSGREFASANQTGESA